MTEQTLPFVRSSATSAHAARTHTSAAVQRAAVLGWFRDRGEAGGTDGECQAALALSGSSQRPRRVELVRLGLLRDSGGTRLTESGRPATIWVVA